MANARETVQKFHDLFNKHERDELMAMATDDIAIGGARGKGAGKKFLDEWVGRATTTMMPRRWFMKDDTVVVEEFIEWRSKGSDRVTDSTTWGIAFTVREGKIAGMARYAGIGEAVYKAGLDDRHEIR